MPYLTRSAALTDYVEVARAVGVDPYRMLDEVSLPRACLRNPDLKISAGAVGRLLEATARVAGIDDFGLRLAERRVLSNLGPVGLIVREQPTVRKAIEALIQYMGLHSEAQSPRMEDAGDVVTVIVGLVIRRPAPMRQSIELSMGVLYRILRLFLGDAWKPKLICFTHRAPRNRDTYRRLFGIAHLRLATTSTASSAPRAIWTHQYRRPTRRWRVTCSNTWTRSRHSRAPRSAIRCAS
jgi:hypothetical protein